MSILNNKIQIYSNLKHYELVDLIHSKYYDDEIFLSMRFFNDFCDNFNCNFHDFATYVENSEIYSPIDIVDCFFKYDKFK